MNWVTGKIFFSVDLDKINITLYQMRVLIFAGISIKKWCQNSVQADGEL
jgi:hypothetical protein